jgi:hypothetical protein
MSARGISTNRRNFARGALATVATVLVPQTACARSIPLVFNLFGPVQNEGALVQVPSPEWKWPGTALSASTTRMRFDLDYAAVTFARWVVVWVPGAHASQLRLVNTDDGPKNISEMGVIGGRDITTPVAEDCVITDQLNALRGNHVQKHIGFQIKGDGVTPIKLFESRLEINFAV